MRLDKRGMFTVDEPSVGVGIGVCEVACYAD